MSAHSISNYKTNIAINYQTVTRSIKELIKSTIDTFYIMTNTNNMTVY
jgi:hypothetical protein